MAPTLACRSLTFLPHILARVLAIGTAFALSLPLHDLLMRQGVCHGRGCLAVVCAVEGCRGYCRAATADAACLMREVTAAGCDT